MSPDVKYSDLDGEGGFTLNRDAIVEEMKRRGTHELEWDTDGTHFKIRLNKDYDTILRIQVNYVYMVHDRGKGE